MEVTHEIYLLQAVRRLSVYQGTKVLPFPYGSCPGHMDLFYSRLTLSFSVEFNNSFSFTYCQHIFELLFSYRNLQATSWSSAAVSQPKRYYFLQGSAWKCISDIFYSHQSWASSSITVTTWAGHSHSEFPQTKLRWNYTKRSVKCFIYGRSKLNLEGINSRWRGFLQQ